MKKFSVVRLLVMSLYLIFPVVFVWLTSKNAMSAVELIIWSGISIGMFVANIWDVNFQSRKVALEIVAEANELCEKSQFRAALNCLQKAEIFDKECQEVMMCRGDIFRTEQDFVQARNEYMKILKLNPKSFRAHFSLGLIYLKEKKVYEAISEFKSTIDLKPDYSESYFILAQAYELVAEKDKAVSMYKKFLSSTSSEDILSKKFQDYTERSNARIRQLQ